MFSSNCWALAPKGFLNQVILIFNNLFFDFNELISLRSRIILISKIITFNLSTLSNYPFMPYRQACSYESCVTPAAILLFIFWNLWLFHCMNFALLWIFVNQLLFSHQDFPVRFYSWYLNFFPPKLYFQIIEVLASRHHFSLSVSPSQYLLITSKRFVSILYPWQSEWPTVLSAL